LGSIVTSPTGITTSTTDKNDNGNSQWQRIDNECQVTKSGTGARMIRLMTKWRNTKSRVGEPGKKVEEGDKRAENEIRKKNETTVEDRLCLGRAGSELGRQGINLGKNVFVPAI